MLRFCDKEICCIRNDELDRLQLLNYFLNGHRNDPIYVIDEEGRYIGSIYYKTLLGNELNEAINDDHVFLDKNIWDNGKKYYAECIPWKFGEEVEIMLPVLDKERRLICFAWQDREADKELRMLDELMNCANALDFKSVFPEFDCIEINGCNELSYKLVQYLKRTGVPVNIIGRLWKELIHGESVRFESCREDQVLDYKKYEVYGEGVNIKAAKWRISVSPEFECIDRIYEENIRRGIVTDAEGSFDYLLANLKGKQIAVIGIGDASLNAYDLLLAHNLDIYCFISDKLIDQGKRRYGKKVLSRAEVMKSNKDVIFIDAECKYSAWGMGETDAYHYFGAKRNKQFFMLKDYTEIPDGGLQNVLYHVICQNNKVLVLVGDPWLCLRLKQILEYNNKSFHEKVVYCNVLDSDYEIGTKGIKQINLDEICDDNICLLLSPGYYGCFYNGTVRTYREVYEDEIIKKINAVSTVSVIKYSWEKSFFMEGEDVIGLSKNSGLRVANIIIGSHEGRCGNVFFRNLLDSHPDILMIEHGYLNDNLFSICLRIAMVKNVEILDLFWKLYEEECGPWQETQDDLKKIFNDCMKKMLDGKENFTSQELFIMMHIAYANMWGKEIKDYSGMTIYWEPHNVERYITEDYANWLGKISDSRYIINVVRDHCIRTGSFMRHMLPVNKDFYNFSHLMYREILFSIVGDKYLYVCKKSYDGWKRIILKFEDLKCNPREELQNLCSMTGLVWSEILLETTSHGEISNYDGSTGFNLKPVYNGHEEYLSVFDRFRLSIIGGPWQKKHGYPYVRSIEFSRRELQEMFTKEFRFEKRFVYKDEDEEKIFCRWKQQWLNQILWMNRRKEIMGGIYKT